MKKLQGVLSPPCCTLLFLFLIIFQSLSAQPGTAKRITGKVISQSNGAVVPGASIMVKGTKNLANTNDQGEYVIMAAPGETLVISSVGFSQKEVKVGVSTVMN